MNKIAIYTLRAHKIQKKECLGITPCPLLLSSAVSPSLPASRGRDGIRPNWHKIFWDGRVGRTLFQSSKKRRGKGWLNSCVRAGTEGYLAWERDFKQPVPHIFLFKALKVLFSLNCWIIVWFIHVLVTSFKVCFKLKMSRSSHIYISM